jgi:hypothetical protein
VQSANEAIILILNEVTSLVGQAKSKLFQIEEIEFETTKVVSNLELLIKTLKKFYKNTVQSSFFPKTITKKLIDNFTGIRDSLKSFLNAEEVDVEGAKKIIRDADVVYSFSLQYGLITFGFNEKENQRIFTEADLLSKEYKERIESANEEFQVALDYMKNEKKKEAEKIETTLNELNEKYERATEKLETECDGFEKKNKNYEQRYLEAENILKEIEKGKEDLANIVEEISELTTKAISGNSQVDAAAKEAVANLDAIKTSKVSSKEVLDSINEFFSKISAHEKKMLDIRKDTIDKYNALVENSQQDINAMVLSTNKIIDDNKSQQGEIAEHLRKAIGASLFSAFGVRRDSLRLGKWVWTILLVLCVAAGIWITFLIAEDLKGIPDKAFYVKITSIVPIA